MFKPSRNDLSENPPSPEALLRGFHGRRLQRRQSAILPLDRLEDAQLLGRSNVIFYLSDKRDPKDPHGEGRQGVMKRFYHDQNPEAYLFVIAPEGQALDSFQAGLVADCKSSGLRTRVKKKGLFPGGPLPSEIVELGELEKVDLSIGKSDFELGFEGYRLYVWDDMRTLMAFPMARGRVVNGDVYVWGSHHTHVNWRGIID